MAKEKLQNTEIEEAAPSPQKGSKKVSFFKRIAVQTTAINLVMCLAFIIIAAIMLQSMKGMNSTATLISANTVELIQNESDAQAEVLKIDAAICTLAGSIGNENAGDMSTFTDTISENTALLEEEVAYFDDSILTAQSDDGAAIMASLDESIPALIDAANQIVEAYNNSDSVTAFTVLNGDYDTAKSTTLDGFAQMNDVVSQLSTNMDSLMGQKLAAAQQKALIGGLIFVVLVIISIITCMKNISNRVTKIADGIQKMIQDVNDGHGDLTNRLDVKTESELKLIRDGFNEFIETLQNVMKDVKDGTVILTNSADSMTTKIRSASDNITNTSAALEELAASMDNVSSTADAINEKLEGVRSAADEIRDEVSVGNGTAEKIKSEAIGIKSEATRKKENTGSKMESLSQILEVSVKNSEQVEQINKLTDDILDIASQTNLLALNASIEAARAGEAGKGFAVVAEEISTLASNSKDTAGNIQNISQEVTEAVKTLAENALEVIRFINETVLADYDGFVEVGDKYENAASAMSELLDKFTEKADNLNTIMNDMTDSVETIIQSVQESTEAIGMSASNSANIVDEIQGIGNAMDENNRVTDRLNESTMKFELL